MDSNLLDAYISKCIAIELGMSTSFQYYADGSRIMDYFYQRYESHTPTPMERAGRLGEQIQALIAGGAAVYNEITPGAYRDFIGSRYMDLHFKDNFPFRVLIHGSCMSYFIDGYEWPYSVYSGITEILIFERNGSALQWIGSRSAFSMPYSE